MKGGWGLKTLYAVNLHQNSTGADGVLVMGTARGNSTIRDLIVAGQGNGRRGMKNQKLGGPIDVRSKTRGKVSEPTIRALRIIRDNTITMPKEFAKLMWPDSIKWTNVTKCGDGVHVGGGMYIAAGGYLGKLRHRGLIIRHRGLLIMGGHYNFYLTERGERVLKRYDRMGQ